MAATHNAVRADINDLPEALERIGFDMVPANTTIQLSMCQDNSHQTSQLTHPHLRYFKTLAAREAARTVSCQMIAAGAAPRDSPMP